MNTKLIKPNNKQKKGLFESIILLILGIILITNSNSIVTITFQIIGALIITFGIFHIIKYINLKKQLKIEDSNSLMNGIISISIGLIIVLLASILEVGLRYILGFYLIANGITKILIAKSFHQEQNKLFRSNLINGSIFILLGLYTILIANAALVIIGVLLIISSLYDIINYLTNK